jgi:hypothetical protein
MTDKRKRQAEIFHQIARHLLSLVYLIAEPVLGRAAAQAHKE